MNYTLARLDRGGCTLARQTVDLSTLIEEAAEDATLDAAAKAITLHTTRPAEPALLSGDSALLLRALGNLTRNAVRHAPHGSSIELALSTTPARMEITIADRGPGLPENELERIFEPFVRSRTATPGEGYGLGLAITRRIVHAHGGTIGAQPRAGGGLEMKISLPFSTTTPD